MWVGHALRALGRLDEALASYRRASETPGREFTEAAGPLFWAARTLVLAGRAQEAVEPMERALALDSSPYARSVILAGRVPVLLAVGRYEDALASADESLRIRPYGALTWTYRAQALQQLGRGEEAEAARRRAAELAPPIPGPVSASRTPAPN
jgi:tetratricopeptide (TPR) repeat protein